jgi:hypothetical protein
MTFEEWRQTFDVDKEDQLKLAQGAKRILQDPAARLVMAKVEMTAVKQLLKVPSDRLETLNEWRMVLLGMKSMRNQLQAMASEMDYEQKRSQQQ